MECGKWVEVGLLYTSGELDTSASSAFEQHLSSCEYCRTELESYKRDKQSFYNLQFLTEPTTLQVDQKIAEACMKIPQPTIGGLNLFSSFAKRGVFAALFLLCGFAGGVYVALNLDLFENGATRIAGKQNVPGDNQLIAKQVQVAQETAGAQITAQAEPVRDTGLSDSGLQGNIPYNSQRIGNIGQQGVIPVDLQSK